MIGAASLLLALGLGGAAVPVDFDIPYFLNNPRSHEETLRRCHDDVRLAATPECENAELAGTRRMGRPLSPWTKTKKLVAPPPAPLPMGPKSGA
jgi:hypothetical protein